MWQGDRKVDRTGFCVWQLGLRCWPREFSKVVRRISTGPFDSAVTRESLGATEDRLAAHLRGLLVEHDPDTSVLKHLDTTGDPGELFTAISAWCRLNERERVLVAVTSQARLRRCYLFGAGDHTPSKRGRLIRLRALSYGRRLRKRRVFSLPNEDLIALEEVRR